MLLLLWSLSILDTAHRIGSIRSRYKSTNIDTIDTTRFRVEEMSGDRTTTTTTVAGYHAKWSPHDTATRQSSRAAIAVDDDDDDDAASSWSMMMVPMSSSPPTWSLSHWMVPLVSSITDTPLIRWDNKRPYCTSISAPVHCKCFDDDDDNAVMVVVTSMGRRRYYPGRR